MSRKIWAVTVRYDAEETVWVAAEENWQARLGAQGEDEYGEVLSSTEPDVIGRFRCKKARALRSDEIPDWLKDEAVRLGIIE